jgi:hypothetical protein
LAWLVGVWEVCVWGRRRGVDVTMEPMRGIGPLVVVVLCAQGYCEVGDGVDLGGGGVVDVLGCR